MFYYPVPWATISPTSFVSLKPVLLTDIWNEKRDHIYDHEISSLLKKQQQQQHSKTNKSHNMFQKPAGSVIHGTTVLSLFPT